MSTETAKKERAPRKAKARERNVVLGCIEERLSVIDDNVKNGFTTNVDLHVMRLNELFDELRRSLNGEPKDSE